MALGARTTQSKDSRNRLRALECKDVRQKAAVILSEQTTRKRARTSSTDADAGAGKATAVRPDHVLRRPVLRHQELRLSDPARVFGHLYQVLHPMVPHMTDKMLLKYMRMVTLGFTVLVTLYAMFSKASIFKTAENAYQSRW